MGSRDHDRTLAGAVEHRCDVQHVVGLQPEVELLHDGLGEQLDDGRKVHHLQQLDPAGQGRCQPGHHRQVLVDQPGDPGALDLDRHLLTGRQGGQVDLGDGGGGHRHAVEVGEDPVQGCAQVLLDHRPHVFEGHRGDPVAQLGELLDQFVGEHVLAGRDDLAQLDVGGAEGLEGVSEASGQAGHRGGAPGPSFVCGPAGEGGPDGGARDAQPGGRGDPAAPQEARDPATGLGAHLGQAHPPGEVVDREIPRRVLREGGEGGGHGAVGVLRLPATPGPAAGARRPPREGAVPARRTDRRTPTLGSVSTSVTSRRDRRDRRGFEPLRPRPACVSDPAPVSGSRRMEMASLADARRTPT